VRSWSTSSVDETLRIGEALAAELAPAGALLLFGDLGAGKTVLAQGVAAGLGIAPREVQSPTFTLVREHRGPGGRLVHADLYRLAPEEVGGTGLEELLAGPGVKVVEWAERLPFRVEPALRLEIVREADGSRRIRELS
jgi:tRNA threonylcarbamoyladenosine biosynthesis protein TsaE